ncbi:casein kinase II, regulatory subunit [Gorgonomyces haynaldii]|nr:casein kinase II, regulatory subunit [Gorgonomyces haynaldii]
MCDHFFSSCHTMQEEYSSTGEESGSSWVEWFQSLRGNELFCTVDEDYILDRFNLTGLNNEVQHYALAYELITDTLGQELDPDQWDQVEKSARHLYGLIHARYVLTSKGLSQMAEKMKRGEFGYCPRVLCQGQEVIPIGITDVPGSKAVKLYCPSCQDIYTPPSKKHLVIDGAYFTTSLPHLLLQMYPQLAPKKSTARYTPTIFGFRIHKIAEEHRKQDMIRQELEKRLQAL